MRLPNHGSPLLAVLLLTTACGGSSERRYQLEHRRLLHAERHIRKAEQEIRRLRRIEVSQRRRIARLQRDLAQVRRELRRLRARSPRRRVPRISPPPRPVRRPEAYVTVTGVRFWERRHRKLRKQVTADLTRLLPRFKQCYRRRGWGGTGEAPLRGAFWVVFGVRRGLVGRPLSLGSSLRHRGKNTVATRRQLRRAALLEGCVRQALRALPKRRLKDVVRIAALVTVSDTKAQVRRLAKPAFTWPWKRITRRRSGLRQVCRVGRRHRMTDPLTPRIARPCRRGLRCCYPCGIAGCDSICLRKCPRGLP